MLNALLLSGYIPPSADAIKFMLGILAVSVLVSVLLLWWGLWLVRRGNAMGYLVLLLAFGLPMFGLRLLGDFF